MVKSVSEFCLGTYPLCDLMPSGVYAAQAGEKRRAIGFNRDGEFISKSPENILLEQLGMRRAIGFNRNDELIKNGPSGKETAIGFDRSNEPPAVPARPKDKIGYRSISQIRQKVRERER